jgi:hypothetical protein
MTDLAKAFESLYRGLQRAHGAYTITHSDAAKAGKMAGRAVTVFEVPTIEKWQDHLDGKSGLGLVPINEKNQCRWGAIDIDEYQPGLLEEIEAAVLEMAIPVICIRTKSGGVHITCFLTEPIDARIVRSKMTEIAAAIGYSGVEIYPKQTALASERDCGNWLNMPYFKQAETNRYAIYKGKPLTAEQFIQLAEAIRCTPAQFVAIKMRGDDRFDDGPPCLQQLALEKVAVGGRNDVLFAMGVYARKKFGDEVWESKLDEYNSELFTPPLGSREVQMVCKSVGRKAYSYPCKTPVLKGYCNITQCRNQEFGVGDALNESTLNLGKLVKLCTDPPIWIIDVEGARFELDTETLMSQAKFARTCMDKINQWPPMVKANVWQKIIQEKLADVELIDAPKEASTEGRLLWHLENFCVNTTPAKAKDEMLKGKPMTVDGRHYFRSEDLIRYLTQHGFREITPRKMWSLLRHHAGAKHEQFSILGRCVQAWSVPEFAQQTADFEPYVGKEEF